jgi:Na+-driven multidrug efflux pump
MGITGAALSSTISYCAALVLQLYFYKKLTNIPFTELILIKKGDLERIRTA